MLLQQKRTQRPACALHKRHACCRVLDISQAGRYNVSHRPYLVHITRFSAMQLGYGPFEMPLHHLNRSLSAFVDVTTSISGSLDGANRGASTILDDLILGASDAHYRGLKFQALLHM
jgi:hypothetical protein